MTVQDPASLTCWRFGHPVEASDRACTQCGREHALLTLLHAARGRFVIQGELGAGAFGSVYSARDSSLSRPVALKVLTHKGTSSGELSRILAAMYAEGQRLSALSHPNIVAVYDVLPEEQTLVMELVTKGNLRSEFERRLDVSNIVEYFAGIFDGLAAAHAENIIHRDLKPENVLVDSTGAAKIADFGVARLLGDSSLAQTRAGTPLYMAPEVLGGLPYGREADLHSIGCMLYEALTGQLPYSAPFLLGLIAAKAEPPLDSLRDVRPNLPEELYGLVDALLAPQERRAELSAEACAARLRTVLRLAQPPTLRTFEDRLQDMYFDQNYSLTSLELYGRACKHLAALASAVVQGGDTDKAVRTYFPRAFAYLSASVGKRNLRLGTLLRLKYGSERCPHCAQSPCSCSSSSPHAEISRNQDLLGRVSKQLTGRYADDGRRLNDWVSVLNGVYGERNRAQGAEAVAYAFMRRIIRTTGVLADGPRVGSNRDVSLVHLELADVLAWFITLVALVHADADLEAVIETAFSEGCYACRSEPCRCGPRDNALLPGWDRA